MRPTEEQAQAVDLFLSGESLRVHAFAGAGKSSTLRFMARATPRRGIYLAFNASIAREARATFPSTLSASTLHAHALPRVRERHGLRPEKLTGTLDPAAVTRALALTPESLRGLGTTPRGFAARVLGTVQRFCQGGDPALHRDHVLLPGGRSPLARWRSRGVVTRILREAGRLWERMCDPRSALPLGHDGYLKLWALERPVIPVDYVLLDEAQDSSGVVVELLARQPCQVVYVGDKHQQIYAWRGAVNAMDRVRTRHTSHLTRSFRFGPVIAQAASRVLRELGEKRPVRGNPAVTSVLGGDDPQAVLCRSNATVLETVAALASRCRVAVVGGTADLERLLDDAERLSRGRPARDPLLRGYRSWAAVVQASREEDARELRRLVRPVQRHGVAGLAAIVHAARIPEEAAQRVVSTVHKAKGREWSRVALADDFRPFQYGRRGQRSPDPEALRLVYVAITRARHAVRIPARLRAELRLGQSS